MGKSVTASRFDDAGAANATGQYRCDLGALKSPERLPNGWRRVDAVLTRSGVFTYYNADGSKRREYRPPSEVFDAASMKSFGSKPFTNDHPRALLDAKSARAHVRGWTMDNVAQDGETLVGSIMVIDQDTADDMDRGKVSVSCGYTCDLDWTPGEVHGEKYDAVQKNIRGNHVSLVFQPRAKGARIKMDRMDGASAALIAAFDALDATENITMTHKIVLDGVTHEVTQAVAEAYAKVDAANKAAVAAEKARADAATARADSADAALGAEKARADAASNPARIRERAALQTKAAKFLAPEVAAKFDTMTDREIKRATAEKLMGKPVSADKCDSDAYIDGLYDAETARADASTAALGAANVAATGVRADGTAIAPPRTAATARADMYKDLEGRHKAPITGAVTKA